MKPLRILLVGNYAPDHQESMQRFAQLLNNELKARGHVVRLLQPSVRLNKLKIKKGEKWLGYVDKYLLFPPLLRRVARRFDIVHICDHSNAPYVHSVAQHPHLINCHDVLAILSAQGVVKENPIGWSGKILQRYIALGLSRARNVSCISHKTREQLLMATSQLPLAVRVIYMGQNYQYSPMAREQAQECVSALVKKRYPEFADFDLSRGFIFNIGGNHWYKNREGVIRIYASLLQQNPDGPKPYLIMAGQKLSEEMQAIIANSNLQNSVLDLQNVSNEELRALYSCAELLLFPSLAEGFGWPIAEAQACGCRVLTTNERPMTEVGGDAAMYCDPKDEDGTAQLVAQLLHEDEEAKANRIQASLDNAQRFTTSQMIDDYENLYRQIVEEQRGKA